VIDLRWFVNGSRPDFPSIRYLRRQVRGWNRCAQLHTIYLA